MELEECGVQELKADLEDLKEKVENTQGWWWWKENK
jgi:hypothetical protein